MESKKTAIILCGGIGSRLGNLGKKLPKCLVPINGRPIIWYIVNILKKNSFNHFILPIGYKGKMIKKFFKKNKEFKNLNIELVNTGLNTKIAKRIHLVKKKIISENFLLLNGDAIFDFGLKNIFQNHINKRKKITFLGSENQLPYGTIGVMNNKIVNFERNIIFDAVKSRANPNFTAYVYSGMAIINKKLLDFNFKNYDNFEKKIYPKFIKKYDSDFIKINGFWHSIDNLKDIEETKKKNNIKKFTNLNKIKKKF
tara:strand:+ start:536 stop:1300 length:765 start_codon:yes stop_codon:yes gene_type:complete